MYINGLMDSKSAFKFGSPGLFLGERIWICFSIALRVLKWVGNRKKRFCIETWGKFIWGVRALWKSSGTLYVWWAYGNCWMHMGKYLVHARLDSWILPQNCWNTLPWHTVDKLVRSAQNEKVAGGDKLCGNLSPRLNICGTTWWKKDLHTQSKIENGR